VWNDLNGVGLPRPFGPVEVTDGWVASLPPCSQHEGSAMAKKRLSKRIAKLEKKSGKLRKKADKKGKELQSVAAERVEELSEKAGELRKEAGKKGQELRSSASDKLEELTSEDEKSRKGLIVGLLAVVAGAIALVVTRKND
jgi:hypothetical protein